jgi:RNA polymerase subunit RPABC4/transcription elongation factor Spt4
VEKKEVENMDFDLKKMISGAKDFALVAIRRMFFLMGVMFLGIFLFSTAIGLVLTPFIGNGTQVFGKLFCAVTHGSSCLPLNLLDIVYAVFVVILGSITIISIFSSIASNILAATTGIEPTSKGIALLSNFISGICILILIIIASVIASIILLLFVFLSFGLFIYVRKRLGKDAKRSSIISSAVCAFSAIFVLFAWPSMGISLLVSFIPAFFLFLLAVLLVIEVLDKRNTTEKTTGISCRFCQKLLDEDSLVCGFCGKRLYSVCKKCDKKFSSELNFCPNCGSKRTNQENL